MRTRGTRCIYLSHSVYKSESFFLCFSAKALKPFNVSATHLARNTPPHPTNTTAGVSCPKHPSRHFILKINLCQSDISAPNPAWLFLGILEEEKLWGLPELQVSLLPVLALSNKIIILSRPQQDVPKSSLLPYGYYRVMRTQTSWHYNPRIHIEMSFEIMTD